MADLLDNEPVDKVELQDSIREFDKRIANLDAAQEAVEVELSTDDLDEEIDLAGTFRETAHKPRIVPAQLLDKLSQASKMMRLLVIWVLLLTVVL